MKFNSDLISLITITGLMVATGVLMFIWMASTSFTDKTGIAVGIIFLVLGGVQAGIDVLWWRMSRKSRMESSPASSDIELKQPVSPTEMKLVDADMCKAQEARA